MGIENELRKLVRENGLLHTEDVVRAGYRKETLRKMLDDGVIEREARGIYSFSDELVDEYALLQARKPRAVFSHGTALFLHGFSDRVPSTIDVTVPWGYKTDSLEDSGVNLRTHRVREDLWGIGMSEATSPLGGTVLCYDPERAICDVIGAKAETDPQVFQQGVTEFFESRDADTVKLMEHAKALGVAERVQTYMEVLRKW